MVPEFYNSYYSARVDGVLRRNSNLARLTSHGHIAVMLATQDDLIGSIVKVAPSRRVCLVQTLGSSLVTGGRQCCGRESQRVASFFTSVTEFRGDITRGCLPYLVSKAPTNEVSLFFSLSASLPNVMAIRLFRSL